MLEKETVQWFAVGLRGLGEFMIEMSRTIERELLPPPGIKGEEPKPPPEPTVSFEELRAACTTKSAVDKVHSDRVKALITEYGAEKLSGVEPSCYVALLAEVNAI